MIVDHIKYKQTINNYISIPYWNLSKGGLFECRNNFERLIWFLSNPLKENKPEKMVALLLSVRQAQFGVPSIDPTKIDLYLSDPQSNIDTKPDPKDKASGNFYVVPELPEQLTFAQIKVAVKVIDLEMKSSRHIVEGIRTLDKSSWEAFWQLYNLVQQEIQT